MDELDLTEKTPRTFDEDDLQDDASLRNVTPTRTARGTRTHTVPPPLPAMRLAAAPPAKLIPFLPPPEPQSPVPGSFPVVRAKRPSTVPPPIPAARGSIAPRVTRASAQMSVPRAPAAAPVDAPLAPVDIDVGPFEVDAPHVDASHVDAQNVDTDSAITDPAPDAGDAPETLPELTGDLVRAARPRRYALFLAGIAVCATLIGTVIGLAIRNARGPRTRTPVPPALARAPAPVAPEPAPPPSRPPAVEVAATTSAAAVAPVASDTPDDEPAHGDLAITSQPEGATVTLIANGDATIVGKTPITAPIDPTLRYDVVFALRDHPTTILHIDPSKVHELAVDLSPRTVPAPPRRRKH